MFGFEGENSMTVANTIKDQLGRKALAMMGAKNLVGDKNSLSFRIDRNSKKVNGIKITLTPMDLYDVEFGAIRDTDYKIKYEAEGIYVDQLHDTIERNTRMYLSL